MASTTNYVLWDDVILRYSQLEQLGGGSEDVKASHITPAEQELHSRLASFFAIPFSSTNLTAVDLVIDMVRVRAGIGKEKDLQIVRDRIDKRIMRLISGEETMIVCSANGNLEPVRADVAGTVWNSHDNYHPTFGHGDDLEFVVDSSKLEDERNARGVFP